MRTPESKLVSSFNIQSKEAVWHGKEVIRVSRVDVRPLHDVTYSVNESKRNRMDLVNSVLKVIASLILHEIHLAIYFAAKKAGDKGDESLYDKAWKLGVDVIDRHNLDIPYILFSGEDAVVLKGRWNGLLKSIRGWLKPNEYYIVRDDDKELLKAVESPVGIRDYYAFLPQVKKDGPVYKYYNVPAFHRRNFEIRGWNSDCGFVFQQATCRTEEDANVIAKLIEKNIDTSLDDGLYKDYRHPKVLAALRAPHPDWKIVAEEDCGSYIVSIKGDDRDYAKLSRRFLDNLLDEIG